MGKEPLFWGRVFELLGDREQRWLIDQIGSNSATFSTWKREQRMPKADVVGRMAKALGTTVEYLVTGELIRAMNEDEVREHAPAYGWTKVPDEETKAWVGKNPELVAALMRLDPTRVKILERAFLNLSGHVINSESYEVASHVPQKLSAGLGQSLLEFPEEDLISRAPYPAKWGKGLLCAEVVGDSMTGANIFDGDLVYFRPGEIRGNGLYVLQLNGTALVKRLEFDDLSGKLTIISENPRYQQKQESSDSQAITILGKVRGWMHGHPY